MYLALTHNGDRPAFVRQGILIEDWVVPFVIPTIPSDIWIRRKFYDPWVFYKSFTKGKS